MSAKPCAQRFLRGSQLVADRRWPLVLRRQSLQSAIVRERPGDIGHDVGQARQDPALVKCGAWSYSRPASMETTLDRLRSALAGRYEIERELGRGAMATVYLAKDLKHNRNVAIKVLLSELSFALGPERFRREIDLASHLSHPHILPIYDSGEAEGELYYVMPYVEGESLRSRLNNRSEEH